MQFKEQPCFVLRSRLLFGTDDKFILASYSPAQWRLARVHSLGLPDDGLESTYHHVVCTKEYTIRSLRKPWRYTFVVGTTTGSAQLLSKHVQICCQPRPTPSCAAADCLSKSISDRRTTSKLSRSGQRQPTSRESTNPEVTTEQSYHKLCANLVVYKLHIAGTHCNVIDLAMQRTQVSPSPLCSSLDPSRPNLQRCAGRCDSQRPLLARELSPGAFQHQQQVADLLPRAGLLVGRLHKQAVRVPALSVHLIGAALQLSDSLWGLLLPHHDERRRLG